MAGKITPAIRARYENLPASHEILTHRTVLSFALREEPMSPVVRRGFTLVELLIAVAIIILLIAILFPALSRVREEGRRVRCMNNARQLSLAWLLYANDFKGHFCNSETQGLPPWDPNQWIIYPGGPNASQIQDHSYSGSYSVFQLAGYPNQPEVFWSWIGAGIASFSVSGGMLWPYTKDRDIYQCPSDLFGRPVSYQINGLFAGQVGMPRTWLTLSQCRNPERTLLFIEAYDPRTWLVDSFRTPLYPNPQFGSMPGQNHGNKGGSGCTVSFADGHVIFWQYASLWTAQISSKMFPNMQTAVVPQGTPDVYQLEAWSGGPLPPGPTP